MVAQGVGRPLPPAGYVAAPLPELQSRAAQMVSTSNVQITDMLQPFKIYEFKSIFPVLKNLNYGFEIIENGLRRCETSHKYGDYAKLTKLEPIKVNACGRGPEKLLTVFQFLSGCKTVSGGVKKTVNCA